MYTSPKESRCFGTDGRDAPTSVCHGGRREVRDGSGGALGASAARGNKTGAARVDSLPELVLIDDPEDLSAGGLEVEVVVALEVASAQAGGEHVLFHRFGVIDDEL